MRKVEYSLPETGVFAVRAIGGDTVGNFTKATVACSGVGIGIAYAEAVDLIRACANHVVEEAIIYWGTSGYGTEKTVEIILKVRI